MRHVVNGALFVAGVAVAATALAPSSAQPPRGGGRGPGPGCTYFQDANYQGARERVRDGEAVRWIGDQWNDQISAIRCDPGCVLEAYEDIDYGGARERYRGDIAFVGPAWNDRISALRVHCGGSPGGGWGGRGEAACTFYEHANYQGRRERADQDVLFVGPAWNDQISSIQCRPGCALEAYEHANHAGMRQIFPGATAFVGPQWNDQISSYRIRCRR